MRVAVLHLSDFHLQRDSHVIEDKIGKIVDALTVVGTIDKCIIVFSGDVTNRGQDREYNTARFVFGKIVSAIHTKYDKSFIPLLCVPGNHDLLFTHDARQLSDIRQYYEDGTIDTHVQDEINMLGNYFTQLNAATNKQWQNGLYSRFIRDYDGCNIQINLINTAPFSTLKPDDKESHYFPRNMMHLLRKSDAANICITVMHHGIEWFDWSCKDDLEKTIYDNSEFLLTGHDHIGKGQKVSFGSDSGVWVSAAGSIDFTKSNAEDSFNAIVIDTDDNTFSAFLFTWNAREYIFEHKQMVNNKDISAKSHRLHPRPSFIKELKTDTRHRVSTDFTDYFVFPKLSVCSKTEYADIDAITSYDEFTKYMAKHDVCNIDGEANSGKSTLLNYLFIRLSENCVPLLWNASAVKVTTRNLTKYLFDTQYGDAQSGFERYLQTPKDDKYILVDNWDVVSDRQKEDILDLLTEQFGHVIIFRNMPYFSEEMDNDTRIEDIIAGEKGKRNTLIIEPFFYKKRNELVQKVCLTSSNLNESDIERVNSAISALVQNHVSMFILNPEFIIQYTQYFAKEQSHSYQHGEKIFSKIFEANITTLIMDCTTTNNVDEYITVLEELAYYMYKNRVDSITIESMYGVIKAYNEAYTVSVVGRKFSEAMLKAKILRYTGCGDDITFSNRNYLAYFIARYICRDYNNNGNFDDVNDCAKYVCFGINSDILLFITYLTSNMRIIKAIQDMAEGLMKDWIPLEFDDNCNNLFPKVSRTSISNLITEPTEEDRIARAESADKCEESQHAGTTITTKGIFDFDQESVDSRHNQMRRGFAYVEVLSKSLPAFSNFMRSDQKSKLVEALYSYPAKLLLQILLPINNKFDRVCKQFEAISLRMAEEKIISKPLTELESELMVRSLSLCMVLSVLNSFAEYAVDDKTIKVLLCDKDNPIAQIERLLFIENSGNTELLYHEAMDLLKNNKKEYIKSMIRSIIRKHLLTNNSINFSKRTQIVDTIFGKTARKELCMPVTKAV